MGHGMIYRVLCLPGNEKRIQFYIKHVRKNKNPRIVSKQISLSKVLLAVRYMNRQITALTFFLPFLRY